MMIRHSKRILYPLAFVVLSALLLSGCGKKQEPAPSQESKPPVSKASDQKKNTPLPVQQQATSGRAAPAVAGGFEFGNQKDPFKPFIEEKKASPVVRRNRLGQALPILNYDVAQFKVSGIIVGMRQNSAMIVDPSGKPYVVKAGMDIGRNNGRITKITPTAIEVYEQYRDESGKLIKKTVRMTLPKKE